MNKLRLIRETLHLSVRQAGEKFGCSGSYISRLERGQRDPGRDLAIRIKAAWGLDWPYEIADFPSTAAGKRRVSNASRPP